MKLPAATCRVIADFPLGFVATVDARGRPCVSPKGTFLALDDETIAFGAIRSPGTLANLAQTPDLEVNFVDPFLRKGARIRGRARILPRGSDEFATLIGAFRAVWGDLADRIVAIVRIPVDEVKPLTTPPYDDGATEAEMIALYKAKYAAIYP